jgi:uncharacterized membrane protein
MNAHEAPARRARLWPALRSRPRLLSSIAFGLLVYAAVDRLAHLSNAAASLVAWNAGAVLDLLLTWHMARKTDVDDMRRRAVSQDEGRMAILTVVLLAAVAVLLAVGTQLSQVRNLEGTSRVLHVLLSVATIASSWLFTQSVFAQHYAHDFYLARVRGAPDPLSFPGTQDPLYADFFHFACVIGTSGQTADIAFTGSALRPIGTVHCIVAFFFNASLLALSINVAAGVMV